MEDRGKCRKGARLEERPVQGGGAETLGLKARNKAMMVVVPLRMGNVIIFVCVCVCYQHVKREASAFTVTC